MKGRVCVFNHRLSELCGGQVGAGFAKLDSCWALLEIVRVNNATVVQLVSSFFDKAMDFSSDACTVHIPIR